MQNEYNPMLEIHLHSFLLQLCIRIFLLAFILLMRHALNLVRERKRERTFKIAAIKYGDSLSNWIKYMIWTKSANDSLKYADIHAANAPEI